MVKVCLVDNSVLKYKERFSLIIRKLICISIILLFFVSCSPENGILMSSSEEVNLESVEDGSFLKPGDSVPVVLSELGDQATLVKMVLKDNSGNIVAETELEPEMLKGLGLPIDLPPDLAEGAYYLHFDVMDGDLLLYEDDRYIFVVTGDYSITSLETFPSDIRPGDTISARIALSVPEESDPWIRWTLDDEVVSEGLFSDIGITCRFSVPEKTGVYTLKAELFPETPRNDQYSTVLRHTDLFVTTGEGDNTPWTQVEDRTYQYFIDFSDSLTNRMNPEDKPVVLGSPRPYSQGGYSGLSFGMDDGLIYNQYALPLSPDGRAEDFILSMAFSYSFLPEAGVYNLFRTGDDNTYFSVLYLADSREFFSEFKSYSRSFQSSISVDEILASEAVSLDVNYTAGEGVASLSWRNGGKTLSHDTGIPVSSLVKGKTYIGKDGTIQGFPMNWYTLGVSSVNPPQGKGEQRIGDSDSLGNVVMLYDKSAHQANLISIRDEVLGEGLSTLEIQTDSSLPEPWVFVLEDKDGNPLYTMSSEEASSEKTGRDRIILSLSNDSRGLFLSTSLNTEMNGPFEYQNTLNFEIYPVNRASGTLDDIRFIRLFQD